MRERTETYDPGARHLPTDSVLANIQNIASRELVLGSGIVVADVSATKLEYEPVGLQLIACPTRRAFDAARWALSTPARRKSAT